MTEMNDSAADRLPPRASRPRRAAAPAGREAPQPPPGGSNGGGNHRPEPGGGQPEAAKPPGAGAPAPGGQPAAAEGDQAAAPAAPPAPGAYPIGWSFRDFLVPYILLALSLQRAHGYVIEQYLRGLGLVNVELSTLYRTLRQLEKDGLVFSAWEPGPEGPARRVYSLTDAGRWWLDASATALETYRSLIDRFFGSYPGSRPGGKDTPGGR